VSIVSPNEFGPAGTPFLHSGDGTNGFGAGSMLYRHSSVAWNGANPTVTWPWPQIESV
jgi:hypothetical protein